MGIFLFLTEKPVKDRKINRRGQGPEEYVRANEIALDEAHGEIFINSEASHKILVYDLYGTFKRCLSFSKDVSYTYIFDYDKDNLIGYDMSDYYKKGEDRGKAYHVIISKQDGSITREIFIPFKTINTPMVRNGDSFMTGFNCQIRSSHGKWILMDTSSDTLYNYTPDGKLTPFIVRTPSAYTMEPEVFLYMGTYTYRYYFMETMINKFNFEKSSGFYGDVLMYDKEENAIFQPVVYNDDYAETCTGAMISRFFNQEIESSTTLDAYRLVENYKQGKLKDGKLKNIAAKLSEEDNPVIMLTKQKK